LIVGCYMSYRVLLWKLSIIYNVLSFHRKHMKVCQSLCEIPSITATFSY